MKDIAPGSNSSRLCDITSIVVIPIPVNPAMSDQNGFSYFSSNHTINMGMMRAKNMVQIKMIVLLPSVIFFALVPQHIRSLVSVPGNR